jgi:hypothetical protein
MVYKGTFEGTIQEFDLINKFNNNKLDLLFDDYLKKLKLKEVKLVYMVKTDLNVYSNLSMQNVMPKADAILIKTDKEIDSRNLIDLSEKKLLKLKVVYEKIEYSGISIKMEDSKSFQIMKITPSSFKKLFGNNLLASGASIYSEKINDLKKNLDIIKGWSVDLKDFLDYFSELIVSEVEITTNLDICKKIKEFSSKKIKETILNSEYLIKVIFKGEYIFNEPYIAHYIYINSNLIENNHYDFYVTTGSGRSKKEYTLVIKPK